MSPIAGATPQSPRILIAGIGNIFLGDDAFGVEVAQRLAKRAWPEGVRVIDFGIRSLDLVYALLDGYDTTILVDAVPRGGVPGTLYVIEPELAQAANGEPSGDVGIETHTMDPVQVLRLATTMGGKLGRVLVVGCEPTPLVAEDEMQMGLSPAAETALNDAAALIESLVARLLQGEWPVAAEARPAIRLA
jgi:hydrogenase maturation protease